VHGWFNFRPAFHWVARPELSNLTPQWISGHPPFSGLVTMRPATSNVEVYPVPGDSGPPVGLPAKLNVYSGGNPNGILG
jgi:hypothetical protein